MLDSGCSMFFASPVQLCLPPRKKSDKLYNCIEMPTPPAPPLLLFC